MSYTVELRNGIPVLVEDVGCLPATDAEAWFAQRLRELGSERDALEAECERLRAQLAQRAEAERVPEAWRIAAQEAGFRLRNMLEYADWNMTDDVIHAMNELGHHLMAGTPEQIGWVQERISATQEGSHAE